MNDELDLDLARVVAAPREAATVILVREGQDAEARANGELEVFAVERHKNSAFMGGNIVFPGGKLDAADGAESFVPLVTTPRAWTAGPEDDERAGEDREAAARALAICACRETLEEAGIFLVDGAVSDAEIAELRARLGAEPDALQSFLRSRTLRLTLDALVPLARWVTPAAEPRRFDTRFFLARAPAGQSGVHDDHETVSSSWATPRSLLERFARKELQLAPPTNRTLELLAHARDVGGAFELARNADLRPICPEARRVGAGADEMVLTLPGDPLHSVRESRIGGATRFVKSGGQWLPAR